MVEDKWWSQGDRLSLSCGPSFNKSLCLSNGMFVLGTNALFLYPAFEDLSHQHVSFRCLPFLSYLYCKIPSRG